jgi:hypothetical protein
MAEKQEYTFTNSAGETFRLIPMNPLEEKIVQERVEAEFRAAGRPLDPPYYEATLPTGEKQKIALRSAADADTPELKEAWARYELARAEFNEEHAKRFLTSCFLCVDADPEQFPKWKIRMRIQNIPIPEDGADRFLLFCNTWVIRSKEDITGLIFAATRTMVKISEEQQRAAEAMFRNTVEKATESIEFTA